ncbi:MAG: glycine--tRNA ligase subunit beta [Myxococcaceae bacterium]
MAESLLLEIGTEELPASFVIPALEELERSLKERLVGARLSHGLIRPLGTPRRLAVLAEGVAERSADLRRQVLGPPLKAAFAADGKPTRAAEKFAEGHGRPVTELQRVQTPKGEYLAVEVEEQGRAAQELLPKLLSALVHGLTFRKSMRWGEVEQSFARPVQWLVALYGSAIVPFVFADVRSGRDTQGHRFLAPAAIPLAHASEHAAALERAHVVADVAERRSRLHRAVREAATRAGGVLREDEGLLDEVTQLVELPCPVVGSFEERHLELPPEVLVQEMRAHQRYFSVMDARGKLLPRFVAVSNTPVRDEALSRRGYERVLGARLSDGRFFFDQDRQTPLAARVPELARVVWQAQLGSYGEKVERLRALAAWLGQEAGLEALRATVDRAAFLAKADLVTGMVGEFPDLQGVMGREYALASGETPQVALAIAEHYLPRGPSDPLPSEDAGALVGMADRLDSLAGLFALRKEPSASADPFGLRRACLGVIRLILGRGFRLHLSRALDEALRLLAPKLPQADLAATRAELLDFFRGRLRALWTERVRADVVEAVLAAGFDDLRGAEARVQALAALVETPGFLPLAESVKRAVNIVEKQGRDVQGDVPQEALFEQPAERTLHRLALSAQAQVSAALAAEDVPGALSAATSLQGPVAAFFETVRVMAEDSAVRENRVRLLRQVAQVFSPLADFARIQGDAGGAT